MTNLKDKLHERVFVPEAQSLKTIVYLSDYTLDWLRSTAHLEVSSNDNIRIFTPSQIIAIEFNKPPVVAGILQPSPEPSYLLTPLELLELRKQWAEEAFNHGAWQEQDGQNAIHGKKPLETYINSLTL